MFQHHVFMEASNFLLVFQCRVLVFHRTHQPFCVFIFNLLHKKTGMLDDKYKPKMSFLLITDLFGLTGSSSEMLVCTCEDHPKSPADSSFSGVFPSNMISKQCDSNSIQTTSLSTFFALFLLHIFSLHHI